MAISLIEDFVPIDMDYTMYNLDRKTQSAVERQLAIIGEAINHFRKLEPQIAINSDRQIINFRNRLIHAYDSLDNSIVWAIIKRHLSPLKEEVQSVMQQKEFWSARWENGETQWDAGSPTAPLAEYIQTLDDRSIQILIPGCGSGYEAELLWSLGFKNVHVIDIAEIPLQRFRERNPDFPKDQLICADFFTLNKKFDLVLEQTFYCAIPPVLRDQYVLKMAEIIHPGGKLAGLLFNFPLTEEGPPFGGSVEEYRSRFSPYFDLLVLKPAENSIKPRLGRELWFEFIRKA